MAIAIDPFLYLAFALGIVGGRVLPLSAPWLERATLGCVLVLIGLLGISLGAAPAVQLLDVVPAALGLATVVLTATILIAWALRSRHRAPTIDAGSRNYRPWLGLLFLLDVIAGFGLGHLLPGIGSWELQFSLYALLVLVAWGLRWTTTGLGRLWVPLTAAVAGSVVGALLLAALGGTTLPVALATTFGFGFYTLAGPLVAVHAGVSMGFLAFLANFLRENLTMILSPWLGRHLRGEGLAAMGGATSMDTTLYFVTRFGDPEAGPMAVMTGLVLTVMATVALPLLLALPGA
ncbi:MAG: lysine exporter LysO family protein [Thermoplasmata archaeon]|nr:lysine exporter LysO family protein [Thermoplasmata archaeon]